MNKLVAALILLFIPMITVAQSSQDPFEEALFEKLRMSKEQQESYQLTGNQKTMLDQIDASLMQRLVHQSGSNAAVINQEGNRNEAFLSQFGNRLDAVITQKNNGNIADVKMKGSELAYELLQEGNKNVTKSVTNGNNALSKVIQSGQGNYLNSKMQGNGLRHEIYQQGKGNYLEQSGLQSVPLIIHQQGRGMKVRIKSH